MFTGIIETLGVVVKKEVQGTNITFTIQSILSSELCIDQSITHNGVCLTVISQQNDWHRVTVVKESLFKSNLGELNIGDQVNLERGLKMGDRLDGHLVQGHVDTTAICQNITEENGSRIITFTFGNKYSGLIVEKGSITIDGVSLTVFDVGSGVFSVAIIPYTYANTSFKDLKAGNKVNIEFDILGKYVLRNIKLNHE